MCLENEANPQLNLTRRINSREYPTDVVGEIPSGILENGVSVSSECKSALRVARYSEIWMIQEIVRIGS
jgi:hypothetical protein